MGRPGPEIGGLHAADSLNPGANLAAGPEAGTSGVRYHPLGTLHFEERGERAAPFIRVVMCLRCGAVVVEMETARHDLNHLTAEGHIPDGQWALIDRPLGF